MGRRILVVSDVFWPMLFGKNLIDTGRAFQAEPRSALPEDAKMINASLNFRGLDTQELAILLESDQWEDQPEGHQYPRIDLFTKAITIPRTERGLEELRAIIRREVEERCIPGAEQPIQDPPVEPIKFREWT